MLSNKCMVQRIDVPRTFAQYFSSLLFLPPAIEADCQFIILLCCPAPGRSTHLAFCDDIAVRFPRNRDVRQLP